MTSVNSTYGKDTALVIPQPCILLHYHVCERVANIKLCRGVCTKDKVNKRLEGYVIGSSFEI